MWSNDVLFYTGVELFPASIKTINGTKWGYINKKGVFKIKPIFDQAMDFQVNGVAVVAVNNKNGVINRYGQFIVRPKYDTISPFSEGRAQVIDGQGFKVIDENGRVLTSKPYSMIGSYNDGRALFANTTENGLYLYGYLNRQGKEVIPARFITANEFHNGYAVVQISDQEFALMNKDGKIIHKYPYPFVGNLSDGLLAFKETKDGKFGYIDKNSDVVIPPKYTFAQPFQHGYAIVNMSSDYRNEYGLINKTGDFLILPTFNDINLLGKNRVALGKPIKAGEPFYGSKYALATTDGYVLTDYKFNSIVPFEKGVASATTGEKSFFINKYGETVKGLPVIKGEGTLFLEGDIIKANIDQRIVYYDRFGNVIWRQNRIIPLNNQFKVITKKYKPNIDYLVYYPQIEGMKNSESQVRVNEKLKQHAQVKPVPADIQLDRNYTGDFSIEFYKDQLLVLEIEGYDFPFGAAHGMPYKVYTHTNLKSGDFYELRDLFKQGSHYVEIISEIIGEQIKSNPEYSYVFPDTYKGISEDQPFYVDEKAIYIYFVPYDIAPYAAGFPTFKILYDEISEIIDTEGEFWRSYH